MEGDWVIMESPFEWEQGLNIEDLQVLLVLLPLLCENRGQRPVFRIQGEPSPDISELSQTNLFLKYFHFSEIIEQEYAIFEGSHDKRLNDYF